MNGRLSARHSALSGWRSGDRLPPNISLKYASVTDSDFCSGPDVCGGGGRTMGAEGVCAMMKSAEQVRCLPCWLPSRFEPAHAVQPYWTISCAVSHPPPDCAIVGDSVCDLRPGSSAVHLSALVKTQPYGTVEVRMSAREICREGGETAENDTLDAQKPSPRSRTSKTTQRKIFRNTSQALVSYLTPT